MAMSNDKVMASKGFKNRKGLSLVELIVVTVVIALTACMAFPVYKIFQQRSKEKRLKKILTDVRAAISGTKSHNSTNDFQEGFRTVVRVNGMESIKSLIRTYMPLSEQDYLIKQAVNGFVAAIGKGEGYPSSPSDIWSQNPKAKISILTVYDLASNPINLPVGELVDPSFSYLYLGRPFYRSKPIHPFHDWYAWADFEYVPVADFTGMDKTSYPIKDWVDHPTELIGVKDIVSKGAGLALDGSDTDEW